MDMLRHNIVAPQALGIVLLHIDMKDLLVVAVVAFEVAFGVAFGVASVVVEVAFGIGHQRIVVHLLGFDLTLSRMNKLF
jgi:hypothetical protein